MSDCPLDLECKDDSGPDGECINLPECQKAKDASVHPDEKRRKLHAHEQSAVAYINGYTRLLTEFVANYTKGLGDPAKRRAAKAAEHYEAAAMWAVKAMVGE